MSTASDPLTFGHRIGTFILAEISAISAAAVTIVLIYIAVHFPSSLVSDSQQMFTCILSDSTAPSTSARAQGVDGE